jgi:hypothetical protein
MVKPRNAAMMAYATAIRGQTQTRLTRPSLNLRFG